jgi:protein-ribulosamine 3-kinase
VSGIDQAISESTGCVFHNRSSSSIGGGCINQASKITGEDGRQYFLKKNQASFLPFFQSEAQALSEISDTQTVRAPEVIAHGLENEQAFLVLEFIEEGRNSTEGQAKLGSQLAQLHRVSQSFFGWTADNCIGATPQPNPKSDHWPSFYRDHRLDHQFRLAASKGRKFEGAQKLLESINSFFSAYSPHPSLLHGDLWGGNASCVTATAKQTLPLPTCLAGFHRLFMMPMKENIQSTLVFSNARPSTTSITNSIISIYLVVAMQTLPNRA